MAANQMLSAFSIAANELVTIVGGGGKTSLLFALAHAHPGRVVITTTTRIFAAQMKLAEAICYADDLSALGELLVDHGRVLIVGEVVGEKAFGVPADLPAQLLQRPDVDVVLVEGDGSRMRPIKAPAAHEPVIPPKTSLVIPVVGIDALEGSIEEVAHRPDVVRSVIGDRRAVFGDRLSVQDIAVLLTHKDGGLKRVPNGARVIPLINKVETDAQLGAARQIAKHTLQRAHAQSPISRVVLGAVKTANPIREVMTPVTAVILAAGEGKRMGQTKQLLPWGSTTVLGQTIQNVKASLATDVCVVSGHEAEKIEAIAADNDVRAIHNTQYATGEMLSSLQTAVRQLPERVTAVLVMLADQPLVEPETIDQLLSAFWQGQADLIAPVYAGKRGNPVLIGRRYFGELLALPVGAAPRDLLKNHTDRLQLVKVRSGSVLQDLDEPEMYEQLRPS